MINSCCVKLNLGIELYRTTKHETSQQERRQDQEAQSHRESCVV